MGSGRHAGLWLALGLAACGGKISTDPAPAGRGAESVGGDSTSGSAAAGDGGTSSGTSGAPVTGSSGADASGGNGANASGSAAGAAGAAGADRCPAAPPLAGVECAVERDCTYVTAVKSCCEETATARCLDGRWVLQETDCDCPEPCPPGEVQCGSRCVDVLSDPDHCGGCGFACPPSACSPCGACEPEANRRCSAGACGATCASDFVACAGLCVDLCTSREHCGGCDATCPAGSDCVEGVCLPPDPLACATHEDCTVIPTTCCGVCGAYTSEDALAIRRDAVPEYLRTQCPDAICPTCDATRLPSIAARCLGGQCALLDLSADPLTTCESDDDCVLRPQQCCECGAPAEYVALAATSTSAYAALVCEAGQACPECEGPAPADRAAVCEGGHCQIAL